MRVFNVRLAAILLGITLALGIGVYWLNRCQVRSFASFFLDESKRAEQRAKEAAELKNTRKEEQCMKDAISYLQWYWNLMPTDYKAREHHAILLADRFDRSPDGQAFRMAYGALEAVVRLDPERTEARRRLVKLAMLPRNPHYYQDAKDHLEALLVDSPKAPDLLEQLAECQIGLHRFDQARETLKKVIADNPAQVTAYSMLAELLKERLSSLEEADQCMAKLVKANPKSAKAHYLRAGYLANSRLRRTDEALEEVSKARQLAPDDADVLVLAAGCNLAKRKYDSARDCLAHGIKVHPSDYRMYSVMFEVEQSAGNVDKALAALQQGLKATHRDSRLLWEMANVAIDGKRLDEARQLLDELQKKEFRKALTEYLDARIEFAQQHWKAALDRFSDVRGPMVTEMMDHPELTRHVLQIDWCLAQCYRALGDREQQELALRRVLSIAPYYSPAKKALADLSGQKGDYLGMLKDLLDLYKARQLAPAGKIQLAQLLYLSILQQREGPPNWKPLEQLLDEVEKSVPDSPDVMVLRAAVLEAQGKTADAEKLRLQACEKYPKKIAAWKPLVARALRDKKWDKAETLLSQAEAAMGDTVELRLLRAQCLLIRGGVGVVERLKELAENAEQFSKADRTRLWSSLSNVASQLDDRELASSLAEKVAELDPNNVEIRKRRFEQAAGAGGAAAARKALNDVEAIVGPDDAYSLWGQAILLCLQTKDSKDTGPQLEKALDYLKRARIVRKDWPQIPILEANIYSNQGKPDLALQALLEAIELGNHHPGVVQQAVQLLCRVQRYAEAERLLHRYQIEQGALPPALMKALAQCLMYLKESDRALEAARKAVPADSKNGEDQVWLGRMLGSVGQEAKKQGRSNDASDLLAEAERALRQAVKLEPKLPLAWESLVGFLVLSEEPYKAEAATQEAEKNVPVKDRPRLMARLYEMIGNTAAAQKEYEDLWKKSPQDIAVAWLLIDFYHRTRQIEPGKILLQGILDKKVPVSGDADLVRARREMAQFLSFSGRYPDLLQAETLIGQNLASRQASLLDRELLARLLANDPDPRQQAREKAIEMFESLGTAATADDRFVLAKLYTRTKNWIKAGDLLRSLVASSDKEPSYLEFYIDELLKHNEMSSAQTYLERLEKLAPNSFGTVSRKADLLSIKKQPLQAFAVLKDYVDNVEAETRNRGMRLRLVAEKLVELAGRLTTPEQASLAAQGIDSAESLFRTFVKENPGQELVLAVFLGRHGKIDEALNILNDNVQTCTVEHFAQACSLILQDRKVSESQMQRLDKIIKAAEARFERVPQLLMVLAVLRTHQGLYSEAIDAYREIPEAAPEYPSALNNLAVLQALQGVKLDESLKLVNRAMELAGCQGSMLDSRASIYLAMKDPEKAVQDMKAAVADSEEPARLFHLAQVYRLAGDDAEAKRTFDEAMKKGLRKEVLQLLEVPNFEKMRQSLQ